MALAANQEISAELRLSIRIVKQKVRPFPPEGSPTEAYAVYYASRGMPVFRVAPGQKVPLTAHGFKDASAIIGQVMDDWRLRPDANVGLATGHEVGFIVIDVDDLVRLETLEAEFAPLPPTWTNLTGRGGKQLFFKAPEGRSVHCSVKKLDPGIDVRGHGGYVVIPPSLHPNGNTYRWAEGLRPDQTELAELPVCIGAKIPAPHEAAACQQSRAAA